MAEHQHHPDCKHNHKHTAECDHGTPTAVPSNGICPVCDEYSSSWAYCKEHFRWECRRHPGIGLHHGGGQQK